MPWILGRESLPALAPDPGWRGRPRSVVPDVWWSVGTPTGAQWDNGEIDVRICWVDASGHPVFDDADAVTIEPAHMDLLPFPGVAQQIERIVTGSGKDTKGWMAQGLKMPPRGLVSVRLTGAIAVGADRAVVQFWRAP